MRIFLVSWAILTGVLLFGCQESASKSDQHSVPDGSSLFRRYCVNCHGLDGSLKTNGAKDLRYSILSLEERILIISEGRNVMTGFKTILEESEIRALAKFTQSLNQTPANGQ
ncbi:MAG: cytochrome c [Saprospiraceae bacterium]